MKNIISLFPYVGGKYRLVPHLVEMVNECYDRYKEIDTYIETCGGGGRLILNLPHRGRAIYSEYDRRLCNLFWAVSDLSRVSQLIHELEQIKNTRTEYERICNVSETSNHQNNYPIQNAAYMYYLLQFSFNGRLGNYATYNETERGLEQRNSDENLNLEDAFRQSFNRLPFFTEIVKNIDIWQADCRKIVDLYKDCPNVLLYIDPPYFTDKDILKLFAKAELGRSMYIFEDVLNKFEELREAEKNSPKDNNYRNGTNIKLHTDIILLSTNAKAKIILSGYNNSMYEHLMQSGWQRTKLASQAVVSSTKAVKDYADEYVWSNF